MPTDYLTYASLTLNAVMFASLLTMRKQLHNLQISLDLAMELLEAQDETR